MREDAGDRLRRPQCDARRRPRAGERVGELTRDLVGRPDQPSETGDVEQHFVLARPSHARRKITRDAEDGFPLPAARGQLSAPLFQTQARK